LHCVTRIQRSHNFQEKLSDQAAMTTAVLLSFLLVFSVHAANDASSGQLTSMATVEAMQQVFSRSEKAHSESMTTIMKSMSPQKAWQVLEKNNLTTTALIEVTTDLHMNHSQSHLRKQPKGYSGLDGARRLLNDMIFTAMEKYDEEITECTAYYASQCGAMEACRGQISASNYIAANSRSLILDAQSTINRCEVDIPTRKQELKEHNEKCSNELHRMKSRLAVIEADIAVMTIILKMTDCDKKKKSFVEMEKLALLRCEDPCAKGKSLITFNHDGLKQQIAHLKSTSAQKLMKDSFSDLFEGVESLESMEFLQLDAEVAPVINKTKFNNPPVPRTQVPGNPCNDPSGGAPSAADKRAAKCTIKKSPQCYKLQERFLNIQAGIKDERDALLEDIADMEKHCKETKETLEAQIQSDEDMLDAAQTKLGLATEKEATAGETARQTAAEHEQLEQDLKERMKKCSANYINSETELCALKKIPVSFTR